MDIYEKQLDHLIFEMSLPFTKEEQFIFGNLCEKIAEDKEFRHLYTSQIKSLYVHNYLAIKNGTYQRSHFTNINNQIMHAIENGEKAPATIDPSLNISSPAETLARIQSIRNTTINK